MKEHKFRRFERRKTIIKALSAAALFGMFVCTGLSFFLHLLSEVF